MSTLQITKDVTLDMCLITNTGLSNNIEFCLINNLYALCNNIIQPLFDKFGKDNICLTSVYRTPQVNKAVGGTPNSSHLHALGVDIVSKNDIALCDIEKYCHTLLFKWVIYTKLYPDKHIHISHKT